MKAAILRGFLRLMSWLPLPLNHAFGSLIGLVFASWPNRLQRIADRNLSACLPQLSRLQRRRLLRKSMAEAGKTVTEMGLLWHAGINKIESLVRDTDGMDLIVRAHEQGKGAILLTPHLGAWELSVLMLARRHPITCLYRPSRLEGLQELMETARRRTGAKLVPTSATGVKALYRALEQHEDVGILPDQDPGKGGMFVPFFGIETNSMTLASRLAQKTGAPVFIGYVERLARGKGYLMHAYPVPETVYDEDLRVSMTTINQAIEDCIRQNPEQYQWTYKRFKARPGDDREKNFYQNN